MSNSGRKAPPPLSTSFRWAGYTLGFAIGGFFDGILLHQILQWHHLLSGIQGAPFTDLRVQILADGLFHLLMYVIGLAGLWLLWRGRKDFAETESDRHLAANALIGFGAWHILDGIASHWLLGIHRIRMDSDMPLFWDLLWFFIFGIGFVLAGWLLKMRLTGGGRGSTVSASLALIAVMMGTGAAVPSSDQKLTIVVFHPGISPAEAFDAISRVEARLIWSDASDQVWAVDLPEGMPARTLYLHGALLVSGSPLARGCIDWIRA